MKTLKFTNFYQLSVEWQFLDKLKVHPVICHEGTERAGRGRGGQSYSSALQSGR